MAVARKAPRGKAPRMPQDTPGAAPDPGIASRGDRPTADSARGVTITVPCEGGVTHEVLAFDAQDGLAVQQVFARLGRWGVVHLASGRRVTPLAFPTREAARACQEALLALAIDWTQPYTAFQTRAMRPRIKEAGALIKEHLARAGAGTEET